MFEVLDSGYKVSTAGSKGTGRSDTSVAGKSDTFHKSRRLKFWEQTTLRGAREVAQVQGRASPTAMIDHDTIPSMLWLIDTAQAAPNVIYVQQASGGMVEWVKILISAATGAVFGILGNVTMEFTKPFIAKTVSKRTVTHQLGEELLANMDSIEGAVRLVADSANYTDGKRQNTMLVAGLLLQGLKTDRFDHYFQGQKEMVYAIPNATKLISLYSITGTLLPKLLERHEAQDVSKLIEVVATTAREYLLAHNLSHTAGKSSLGDLLKGI